MGPIKSARSPSSPATTTPRSASPAWRSIASTAISTASSGSRRSPPIRTGSSSPPSTSGTRAARSSRRSSSGQKYLDLTGQFAGQFKSTRRTAHAVTRPGRITQQEKDQLRERLRKMPIAVLPGAESMAFWWLLDLGVEPQASDLGGDRRQWPQAAGLSDPALLCRRELPTAPSAQTSDVDEALVRYQKPAAVSSPCPSLPWPFYYDENGQGREPELSFRPDTSAAAGSSPPEGVDPAVRPAGPPAAARPRPFRFPHLRRPPLAAVLPSERRRVRPSAPTAQRRRRLVSATPSSTPAAADGGQVAYAWFGLLDTPQAEPLLYDLFTFLATRLNPNRR